MGAAFKLRNGSLLVTTEAPGGIYNSDQLKKIASLADEDSAIVKVTEDQRLALFVSEDKAEEIVAVLKAVGLGVRHYQDGLHQPTTCIGELCPDYQQDALGSALKITEEMSRLNTDSPLKIGINGCAQCCVPCHTLDISIVGDEHGYRISMGGKNSQIPEMATFMAEGVPEAELPGLVHNILKLYKDSAEEGESLQDVMDRVGVSKFAEVLSPYSQDAAGGEDLFGETLAVETDAAETSAADEDSLAGEPAGIETNESEVALDDIEELDDFDQDIDEKLDSESDAAEDLDEGLIDDSAESDFSADEDLDLDKPSQAEEAPSEEVGKETAEQEDDDFADISEEEMAEYPMTEESGSDDVAKDLQEHSQEDLQTPAEDDLDFSSFAGDSDELEIGDPDLDESAGDSNDLDEEESSSPAGVDEDGDDHAQDHAHDHAHDNTPEDLADLSEISDEDLSAFEETEDEPQPHFEADADQQIAIAGGDEPIAETEENDGEEADELEKKISEDIRDSQLIHEPDSNEEDRNAVLVSVENGDMAEHSNVASVSDYKAEKDQDQFEFEGFDVNKNGDYVVSFASGAQLQFSYDLIKNGPRKIKFGPHQIFVGVDSSTVFIELEEGLRMNMPLNAA